MIVDTLVQINNESLNEDKTSQDHKNSERLKFKDYKELNMTDTSSIDQMVTESLNSFILTGSDARN